MRIAYINSEGKTFEFEKNDGIKIADAGFHKHSYEYEGKEERYGIKREEFKKKPSTYDVKLWFCGGVKRRSQKLNEFNDATEFDIANKKRGKLVRGDWYIECYISESDSYADEEMIGRTVKSITIFCPYPFWIKEEVHHFFSSAIQSSFDGLDFPYDYSFDFSESKTGFEQWNIDHYASSHFKMTIYGPCENPRVLINGYPRQVFTSLEANEYLVIDSRNSTVIKHLANGTTVSVYNSRQFQPSIFEKIPSGLLNIDWSGAFGFDITLYIERSEPKW